MGEDPNPQDNASGQVPPEPSLAEAPSEFGQAVSSVEAESVLAGSDAAPSSLESNLPDGAAATLESIAEPLAVPSKPIDNIDTLESPDTTNSNIERSPLATSQLTPAEAAEVPGIKSAGIDRRKIIIVAGISGVVLLSMLLFMLLRPNSSIQSATAETSNQKVAIQQLGVEPTLIDGTAWYRDVDETDWEKLTTESALKQGHELRTDSSSRMILTFDDGSVLRLDENSKVELESLASNDIRVKQASGVTYSRVVTSDRKYSIAAGGLVYQALGTAFSTIEKDGESGVQVYQSSVKVGDNTVSEGKRYFSKSSNVELADRVSQLDIDQLTSDSFLSWCMAEDEKDIKFKDKLGVLVDIKQRSAELAEEERLASEKIAAEKIARELAEKQRLETERKARESASQATVVKLSDGGIAWVYSGEAKDGFKVLYSTTNQSPTFQQGGTSATYVSEPKARYMHLPGECKKGKTCYIRVCVYRPQDSQQPCNDYSNVVTYNPAVAFRGRM